VASKRVCKTAKLARAAPNYLFITLPSLRVFCTALSKKKSPLLQSACWRWGEYTPLRGANYAERVTKNVIGFPILRPSRGAILLFRYFALQGMAFTLEERQTMGIHGLFPPRFKTQEEQLELCKVSFDRYTEDLNKYLYLVGLQVNAKKISFYLFVTFMWCLKLSRVSNLKSYFFRALF
jgi:hypothetical protein